MGVAQSSHLGQDCYQDAHLFLDFDRKTASLDARHVVLTRKEYDLLAALIEQAGEIVPREMLLMRVWGYSLQIRTRTLDVHIRRLRKKLAPYAGRYIETIFGVGYRFQPDQEARPDSQTVRAPMLVSA